MSQANAPVPVADIPVSEKPTASQANSSAASQATTSPQANTTSTPVNTTEPRSSAATPPVVVSNGTVTVPKPAQSLTPTSVPQVAVIPASSNGTASIHAHDHWRVGLCDADDMETCCAAWCVPFCLAGRIKNRLDNLPQQDPDFDECNSTCLTSFGLLCCYMGCIPAYMSRNMVRRTFNIKGNDCLDFLTAFFCTPCALSQADFELKRRAAEASGMSQQYQSGAPQMAYVPPPPPQQRMIQQAHMQPPDAAYLQVPSHSQPQKTTWTQQNQPAQPAQQPQKQPMTQQGHPVQRTEQPQTPRTAQQAPQLPAVQFSPPAQH